MTGRRAARPSPLVFAASVRLVRLLGLPFCRIRVEGLERRPATPYVAIFNHSSTLDVAALAHVVRGPVCFWAKDELRRKPFIGAWLGASGGIYIRRDGHDHGAFAEALARLKEGLPFFLAPEGTRHHGDEGGRPRTGFVRLALMAGVPVLPCVISGAREALPPGRRWPGLRSRGIVRVRVGEPIWLPEQPVGEEHHEALAALAAGLMEDVYRVKGGMDAEGGF